MPTYYRAIFDILPRTDTQPVGLGLLNDVERTLRSWAHESLGTFPELLEDPGDTDTGREWDDGHHKVRVSGRSVDRKGYFWLRWWRKSDEDGGQFQRYLGFRLATEGEPVQADFEVKATADESDAEGFDDDMRGILETLLDRYRCVSLDGDMELTPLHVDREEVPTFGNNCHRRLVACQWWSYRNTAAEACQWMRIRYKAICSDWPEWRCVPTRQHGR